jgi:hypothetical protein
MSYSKSPTFMPTAVAAALLALALSGTPALAQGPVSDVPGPEECVVEPRALPLFPEGVEQRASATPAPLATVPEPPFTTPQGEPADTETVTSVSATVREAIACRNANDFQRAYSLFTQDMLVALFGGPATVDPEIVAAITEKAGPLSRRQQLALLALTDVILLPDGRVGAVVETGNARRAYQDFLIFEQDPASGRWLIDESVALVIPERPQRGTPVGDG